MFDGKSFTLYARRVGYYATVPAPATLRELDDVLADKYGIELPLADLFRFGSPRWNAAGITVAKDIGPSEVGGTSCQHYAFRQGDLDYQIWIQKGEFPLPRKIVITTTSDPARPQFSGHLPVEPGAVVQRRGVHVRRAGRRQEDCARRRQPEVSHAQPRKEISAMTRILRTSLSITLGAVLCGAMVTPVHADRNKARSSVNRSVDVDRNRSANIDRNRSEHRPQPQRGHRPQPQSRRRRRPRRRHRHRPRHRHRHRPPRVLLPAAGGRPQRSPRPPW